MLQSSGGNVVDSLRTISQSAVPVQYSLNQSLPATSISTTTIGDASVLPKQTVSAIGQATAASVGAMQTSSLRLSPLLGVAPLGPKKLTEEHHHQADMLMAAYAHIPHPSDSERLR